MITVGRGGMALFRPISALVSPKHQPALTNFSATLQSKFSNINHNQQTVRQKVTVTEQQGLHVGQTIVVNKAFPFEDVRQFAALSHDTNPIHLNEEYAALTRFGERVVHGVLVLGFVSGVLGTKMPGIGTILISHNVNYPNPTFVGDTVSCKAVIKDIDRRRRMTVHVVCTSLEQNHVVLDGDFNLLVTKEALGLVASKDDAAVKPEDLGIVTDRKCR